MVGNPGTGQVRQCLFHMHFVLSLLACTCLRYAIYTNTQGEEHMRAGDTQLDPI